MNDFEKKIKEAAKVGASYPSPWNIGYQVGYEKGALSPEAKVFHTQGMYTEEEVKDIALKFWFWWYNQTSGTNTYQAFDEWFKTYKNS